jgi:hypothetical protein
MTTYRLRDRKLQQKLDELSHGAFSEMLKTMGRFLVKKQATNVQLGESRFTVTLFKEDFEVEPEYDPNDWNSYPDVTPPEGVMMRCLSRRLAEIWMDLSLSFRRFAHALQEFGMVDAGISLGMETFARAAQLSSAHGSDQCFDSPKNSIV